MEISKSRNNTPLQGSKGGNATSMAELMKNVKSPVASFKKGDMVKGTITKLTPAEILVDIQAKTEAVVLERDKRILRSLLSHLKEGDTVDVQILQEESDMGHPLVSLRRFIDSRIWADLDAAQKANKGVNVVL